MKFWDNFYLIMIARSLALSNEKARLIENRISNLTSTKQKEAIKHFQEDYYVPPDHVFEVTEQVDVENTITNSKQRINSQSVINPRRPMYKQIQMWNHLNTDNPKILKMVTDDYYHESIAVTTSNFLENMRQLVIECEEKIRKKRKELVSETIIAIKKQWEDIRLNLMNCINIWCKRSEEQEIAVFLEKGDVFTSGALAELANRLISKREQIELDYSRLVDLYKDNEILREQEITKHMLTVKNLLKDIWDKHYEFEIHQLDINVASLIEQVNHLPYEFEESAFMRDTLHRSIDDSLAQFSIFKPFFQRYFKREQQIASQVSIRRGEGTVRKNIFPRQKQQLSASPPAPSPSPSHSPAPSPSPPPPPEVHYVLISPKRSTRDAVVDSFLSGTMKELQVLRAERDREWQELTSKVQK